MRYQAFLTVLPFLAGQALADEHYDDCWSEGDASGDATTACQDLLSALPDRVAFPTTSNVSQSANLTSLYASTTGTYWDLANTADMPACIVLPTSAQDVSTTVKILRKYDEVKYNLKSGGHNFNRGFSSVDGGVLISFRPYMQDTILSADKLTASVGPGSRWNEAMPVVNAGGRCVVGGRAGDVGVGGYVILGGISYLSAQYGFASDNVVSFECVLADGTIVDANESSHSELYWALRGGASNFAIVTRYTLVTHPIGKVWAGPRLYTSDKTPQLAAAIASFTAKTNPKAALIPTVVWSASQNGGYIWSLFMFYDGEAPPADIFADFDAINATVDTVQVQSYPQALQAASATTLDARVTDRISPLPNLPREQMAEFLTWYIGKLGQAPWINNTDGGFVLANLAIQPVPVGLQEAKGVNTTGALSVNPAGGDKIWIEHSLAWSNSSYDNQFKQDLQDIVNEGIEYMQTKYADVKPTNYESGELPHVAYNPIFANDAQTGQEIFKSYGQKTYQRLRAVREKYDPDQFWQKGRAAFKLELSDEST